MSAAEKLPASTNTDNLAPLKVIKRWVLWKYLRDGRKVPIDIHSKPFPYKATDKNDPAIWMGYGDAVRLKKSLYIVDGIGFVPKKGDGITFLDFDDVVDSETGEVLKPWVINLVKEIGSYTEITPSRTGLRVPVSGVLQEKGGHFTLDGKVLEAYDDNQFVTITEDVFHDATIVEAQDLLDRLVPYERSTDKRIRDVSEVKLPENLFETHQKVRRVFVKNDLSPTYIPDGFRYNTLLSEGGKIWKTGEYTVEEFWVFLNEVNETMCLNKDGEVEGLPLDELQKAYEGITKMPLKVSGPEVLSAIKNIEQFLISIKPRVKRPHTTDWDVLWGMVQHGKKYGKIQDGVLRVDASYGTLRTISRKRSFKTIRNSLKRLKEMGISSGKDQGDRSNHYLIDTEKLTDSGVWELATSKGKRAKVYQGNTGVVKNIDLDNGSIPPQYYSSSLKHVSENRDLIDSISHTSWYRGVGPTKLSYILALISLGGEATKAQIAEVTDRKSDSITKPLNDLVGAGIFKKVRHGVYAVNLEKLPEEIYRYREGKQEFLRDEKIAHDVQKRRKTYRYYTKNYVFRDGKEERRENRFARLRDLTRNSRPLVSGREETVSTGSDDEQ